MQYILLEILGEGQGKVREKGLAQPMQVLGGEHGQVRALSLRELYVIHMPTEELCTQTRYTHAQPLALSIPSSNACPSCPLGPRLYITDSQLEEQQGLLVYSSSKKEAEHP